MPSFSADWLDRREPADIRARSVALVQRAASTWSHDRRMRVLDLGAGTGSNVRFLRGCIDRPCSWLLADRDADLLQAAERRLGTAITTRVVDLADADAVRALVTGRDLVTASALLDLVSESWLRHLLTECARTRAGVLFALSYDGRFACDPADPEDEHVRRLVNEHQQTDKGFGPALGPSATACAASVLEELGYRVWREPSDWVLTEEIELQSDLIDGWATAAIEVAPDRESSVLAWRDRRLEHLVAERSRIVVGHEDLAALPASIS